VIGDLTPGRLVAALDGAERDERDAWRRTTFLAHQLGGARESVGKLWQRLGLDEPGARQAGSDRRSRDDVIAQAERIRAADQAQRSTSE